MKTVEYWINETHWTQYEVRETYSGNIRFEGPNELEAIEFAKKNVTDETGLIVVKVNPRVEVRKD